MTNDRYLNFAIYNDFIPTLMGSDFLSETFRIGVESDLLFGNRGLPFLIEVPERSEEQTKTSIATTVVFRGNFTQLIVKCLVSRRTPFPQVKTNRIKTHLDKKCCIM